ncbi:MAG TPA: hypothetical protein VF590_23800 [Isosphaeraceae bacterium]|jgi:hypothetical protein
MTAPRRRFTLADAMILVAATALGLDPARRFLADVHIAVSWELTPVNVLEASATAVAATTPCAAMWTLGLLPLRLLPPRPDRRRLRRQPGFVSAAIGLLIGVVSGAGMTAILAFQPPINPQILALLILLLPLTVGPGIAASRLTLRMLGRRQPAADWVERLARLLGWFWIVAAPVNFWVIFQ